ncbi:MAG: phytanoyl-CoA dioxygenase family protein [Pseudomonadota bacterium]
MTTENLGGTERISAADLAHYREHGFAIVENFLNPQELAAAHADIEALLPGWLDYARRPRGAPPPDPLPPPRSRRETRFPFASATANDGGAGLNAISLHPELRRFAATMAGTDELFCEQADLTWKHQGHHLDQDQILHCDYPNHTLAYPPANPAYWQTTYLLYYTDVVARSAPTAVVSRAHYRDELLWPPVYKRDKRPDLYANEVKVTVPAGSLLIYSVRTFHRGTAFTAPGARIAQFISYTPARARWTGIVGWSEQANRKEFARWMAGATTAERELFGFPPPGDPFWDEEALAGVAARYPDMDLTPYRMRA